MVEARPGRNVYLEHAPAFLDQNYEWYLNEQTGELTLILPADVNPGSVDIWAPIAEQLLTVEGINSASKIQNLRFKNLCFAYNNFLLDSEGYSAIQSAHYGDDINFNNWTTRALPGAVELLYAENIEFDQIKLAHTGASGIVIGKACSNKYDYRKRDI